MDLDLSESHFIRDPCVIRTETCLMVSSVGYNSATDHRSQKQTFFYPQYNCRLVLNLTVLNVEV